MDFNMKQRRDESEEEDQETSSSSKLPRLVLNNNPLSSSSSPAPALPLFVPQPTSTHFLYSSDHSTTTSSATKLPIVSGMGGSYFSLAQWQELELQALIFRHLIAGAAVPPELLHLVKKSLVPSPPYYYCNPLHYHPSLLQSGYWGKAAMDPEPGRCRRTDGKKWRCSRDVVVGQKYCERHIHRGRNRSRKPVEIPTSGGEAVKLSAAAAPPRFSLSGSYTSMDLLHHNQSGVEETKSPFEGQNEGQTGGDRTLRHFFDDWPRSLDESENAATNLSISTSDFSLKLGSSNGDEGGARERERPWGLAWETSRGGPMGGPLAEALRSSVSSSSSPTSVLHRLQRTSAWEASFVSS